jgi:hypothetical protein
MPEPGKDPRVPPDSSGREPVSPSGRDTPGWIRRWLRGALAILVIFGIGAGVLPQPLAAACAALASAALASLALLPLVWVFHAAFFRVQIRLSELALTIFVGGGLSGWVFRWGYQSEGFLASARLFVAVLLALFIFVLVLACALRALTIAREQKVEDTWTRLKLLFAHWLSLLAVFGLILLSHV